MSLWFEGVFVISPPFLCGELAVCKTLRRTHFYEVKYSALYFERLDQEQTRAFFETAKNYFAERYGLENIAYASVHLDESTPHMHMGVVPMVDGKRA